MSDETSIVELSNTETPRVDDNSDESDLLVEGILEDLDGLPCDEKDRVIKAIQHRVEISSGPLPRPEILEQYDNTLPGAADRILCLAEKEQAHRHEIDNKCIETDSRDSLLGIISALVICLSTLLVGLMIALNVPDAVGVLSGSFVSLTGLIGIIGTFIKGTKATWKMNGEENKNSNEEGK